MKTDVTCPECSAQLEVDVPSHRGSAGPWALLIVLALCVVAYVVREELRCLSIEQSQAQGAVVRYLKTQDNPDGSWMWSYSIKTGAPNPGYDFTKSLESEYNASDQIVGVWISEDYSGAKLNVLSRSRTRTDFWKQVLASRPAKK